MLAISMICLLLGAALGQRFTVLVLVPTTAIIMVLSVGAGWAHPHSAWWIIKTAGAAAIGLQCGYFAGITSRHLLDAMRSRRSSGLARAEAQSHHPAAR